MLKRQASGIKSGRKKRKGNTMFESFTISPNDDKKTFEHVRVWNISSSEKGRVKGSRKTIKHYSQASPSEESPTSNNPGRAEVDVVEETGVLADSESPSKTVREPGKRRKRIRTIKENDSVSVSFPPLHLKLIRLSRRK
jgi:hypothetical protein